MEFGGSCRPTARSKNAYSSGFFRLLAGSVVFRGQWVFLCYFYGHLTPFNAWFFFLVGNNVLFSAGHQCLPAELLSKHFGARPIYGLGVSVLQPAFISNTIMELRRPVYVLLKTQWISLCINRWCCAASGQYCVRRAISVIAVAPRDCHRA